MNQELYESYLNDVTVDRDKYIGGSDIPVILGLSPYKSRWRLLQEKAGLLPIEDDGLNEDRKAYGHMIEKKIRDYINETCHYTFIPDMHIDGIYRYHSDGYDAGAKVLLEVKSTTAYKRDGRPKHLKAYEAQLAFGMVQYNAVMGILAIYQADLSTDEFDPNRLQLEYYFPTNLKQIRQDVLAALMSFERELSALKIDSFVDSNQDLLPPNLVEESAEIIIEEEALQPLKAHVKAREADLNEKKKRLFNDMKSYGISGWKTAGGISVKAVQEQPAQKVIELDQARLLTDHPEFIDEYGVEVEKGGRRGYIKITFPKYE